MRYTKQQKQEYFNKLRARWNVSKKLSENDETVKALYREVGLNFSYTSFYFTLMDMRANGYDGIPYIDCKTYKKWEEAGFKVKKGEHSKIDGIVWLEINS